VSLDDFTDEVVGDRMKLDLASRVRCSPDEECDRIFPNQFPAVLRVHLENGETREVRVSHNRGGPENPLSDEELETKFQTNATLVLSREEAENLWAALQDLESLDRIDEITRLAQGR